MRGSAHGLPYSRSRSQLARSDSFEPSDPMGTHKIQQKSDLTATGPHRITYILTRVLDMSNHRRARKELVDSGQARLFAGLH
jgi:hypothetical protein